MRTHLCEICALWLIAALTGMCAYAQCTTSYQDQSTDGYGFVVAWDSLIDNYTDSYSGCAPGWGGSFTHTYNPTISLTSASGRYAQASSSGSSTYGSGSGYSSVSVSLSSELSPGELDVGDWYYCAYENINCSVAGLFYSNYRSGFFGLGASVNAYDYFTSYIDQNLLKHCWFERISPCSVYCSTPQYAERVIFNWETCGPRATVQRAWVRVGITHLCSAYGRAAQPQYTPIQCYEFTAR
jgi:hypothetical protein